MVSQAKRRGYARNSASHGSRDTRRRTRGLWGVYLGGIALILARVIYLQVIERGAHQLSSEGNHVELQRQVAERGKILDWRGIELPQDPANAPIVGYTAQVNEQELGCRDGLCYSLGMQIGRAGLAKTQEAELRGRDGGRLVEVDSTGQVVRELGGNPAEAGDDLKLSVDSRLQEIMYRALGNRPGSSVAIDMQGKVLGLVSSVSYDPQHPADYLADTEKHYFLNRAISGVYPPGSVFKLVSAIAGLEQGKIDSSTQIVDTGEIRVGAYRYGNWYFDQYGKTEGSLDVTQALARSNDIFFYKVGEMVGVDDLVKWAGRLGLGAKTGIELPGEQAGFVPNRLWKERTSGERWFLGNTYHLAIGQGDLLTTPAQVARMTLAAISGRLCRLSLLQERESDCEDLGTRTSNLELVKEGMAKACATGGTAYPLFGFEPYVLCKTGTAQHAGQKEEGDKPHAWITVVYPGDNPKMILTVMLESAGEGSAEAGPVAKTILEGWKGMGN